LKEKILFWFIPEGSDVKRMISVIEWDYRHVGQEMTNSNDTERS